jgi:dimethylaniline monooxygenase (N-oxide forming)
MTDLHATAVREAPLTVAVIGAGVSGVVTARTLSEVGCSVTVFEQAPDVGGVWSASRAYPGISTQDDRVSYSFSDAQLPVEAGAHPSGADVRAHLERYLQQHGLLERLHLSTRVVEADLQPDDTWELVTEGPEGRGTHRFDWVVAANGLFSIPHVPDWTGRAAFEAAGGAVLTPGVLADGSVLDGRRVVVVGWGKTACDVAVVAARRGSTAALVARRLTWKYPKRIGRTGLDFRHLVLTRAGERLISAGYRSATGRVLLSRIPERMPRKLLGKALARAIDRSDRLSALGLRPTLDVGASTSLVTDGFYRTVEDGSLTVHREASIAALGGDGDGPWVELDDGTRIRADVVVAATGYHQAAEFLSDGVHDLVRTEDASILLYKHVLALDVPHLAFIGSAHSYRSPLISEVTAAWLAGVLLGRVRLPSPDEQRRVAARHRLTTGRGAGTRTGHLPGVSSTELDELLTELGVPLPRRVRRKQILTPFDPADYAESLDRFRASAAVVARAR